MLPGRKLTLHNPWDAITLFREVEETYFPEIEFIDLNQSIGPILGRRVLQRCPYPQARTIQLRKDQNGKYCTTRQLRFRIS